MANILLIDEPVLRDCGSAIEAMGHACFFAEYHDQVEDFLRSKSFEVFVCKINNKNENFLLFDLVRKYQPQCRCVAVIPESLEEYFSELLPRAYPNNFLADNRPIDVQELVVTIRKLISNQIFGIDKYDVHPEETVKLHSSSEKYPVIERVRSFFLKHNISERIVRNMELILNELLMNAMFDAPMAANGSRPYAHLDRSVDFDFKAGEGPSLSYGVGKSYFGVSVSDPFGKLNKETFFSYVNRCFSERSILEGRGTGAGMGLFLVFKSLDKMIINVEADRQTEVIALIEHGTTLGELKKRQHSFHYFQIDDAVDKSKKSD